MNPLDYAFLFILDHLREEDHDLVLELEDHAIVVLVLDPGTSDVILLGHGPRKDVRGRERENAE